MTLPTGWVRKMNLNAGDEINVVENENSLILNGKQQDKDKQCEIDLSGMTIPLLWRYFQSAYRAGCNEIRITFDPTKKYYEDAYHYYTTQFDYAKLGEKIPDKPALAIVHEITSRFLGIDIIESGEGYCIVKEMAEVSPRVFDTSLRRIFLIILQMFERITEAIEQNQIHDSSICKEIHTIDLGVDKLVDYCARLLNKISDEIPNEKKPLLFSSLFILELVGDEFKYIGKHLALSTKPLKEVLPLARLVHEHFEAYYQLYYKFERETSLALGKRDREVYENHFKFKEKVRGEARSILKHLMMISKLTLSLIELRIQMEY